MCHSLSLPEGPIPLLARKRANRMDIGFSLWKWVYAGWKENHGSARNRGDGAWPAQTSVALSCGLPTCGTLTCGGPDCAKPTCALQICAARNSVELT